MEIDHRTGGGITAQKVSHGDEPCGVQATADSHAWADQVGKEGRCGLILGHGKDLRERQRRVRESTRKGDEREVEPGEISARVDCARTEAFERGGRRPAHEADVVGRFELAVARLLEFAALAFLVPPRSHGSRQRAVRVPGYGVVGECQALGEVLVVPGEETTLTTSTKVGGNPPQGSGTVNHPADHLGIAARCAQPFKHASEVSELQPIGLDRPSSSELSVGREDGRVWPWLGQG